MHPGPSCRFAQHGIEVRPSWLPFTPWTTLDDLIDLIDFVVAHDLVANVDPVQYTVRLLLPEGSLLLGHAAMEPHLGHYDPERLGWTWSHPDPMVDRLQQELAALVEARVEQGSVRDVRRDRRPHPFPGHRTAPLPHPTGPSRRAPSGIGPTSLSHGSAAVNPPRRS